MESWKLEEGSQTRLRGHVFWSPEQGSLDSWPFAVIRASRYRIGPFPCGFPNTSGEQMNEPFPLVKKATGKKLDLVF